MRSRASNIMMLLGLAVSLMLHAVLIVPGFVAMLQSSNRVSAAEASFTPEDFREREPESSPVEPEVEIGIDAPTPSSFTWIGYEEYEEHLAELSEVEQAAFTDSMASAAPSEPVPPQPVTPNPPRAVAEATPPEPTDAQAQAMRLIMDDLLAVLQRPPSATVPTPPTQEDETTEQPPPPEQDPKPDPEPTPAQPQEQPQPPAPAASGVGTQGTETPEDDPPEPGELSDRESSATSLVKVPLEELSPGKPLARPGMEMKPQKPIFRTLTRLTALPSNPIVEIRFGRDGVPKTASILRSSGDTTVDHNVETSLYKWRATGKALEDLRDDETVDVRIQIILNSRASVEEEEEEEE